MQTIKNINQVEKLCLTNVQNGDNLTLVWNNNTSFYTLLLHSFTSKKEELQPVVRLVRPLI